MQVSTIVILDIYNGLMGWFGNICKCIWHLSTLPLYVLQMWNSHANLSHPCNHANIIFSNSALPDSLPTNFLFCIWYVFYFVIKCMSYLLQTRVLIHLLMWKVTSSVLCLTIDASYHSNDSQVIHTYLVRFNVTWKWFNKSNSYHITNLHII